MKQIQALKNQKTVLLLLGCIAMVLAFASSDEPVISILQNTQVEKHLLSLGWKNSIVFNLAIGYLVSLIFWFLVVHLPEKEKKQILKANLRFRYTCFKEKALQIFQRVGNLQLDVENLTTLLDHEQFKSFFNREKWADVKNGLVKEPEYLSELLLEMEMFAAQINYVLNNLSIHDKETFDSLNHFKETVIRYQHSIHYVDDQAKYVTQFLWNLFAHWDFLYGHQKSDYLQDAIDRL